MAKIDSNQNEIVTMFTRIMDKLVGRGNDLSESDTNLEDPQFSIKEFPCSDISDLEKLNTLCGTKPSVKKILVSTI